VAHCVKRLTAIGEELHKCNLHKVLTDVLTRGDSCEIISLYSMPNVPRRRTWGVSAALGYVAGTAAPCL
jgi:hypothetical protein